MLKKKTVLGLLAIVGIITITLLLFLHNENHQEPISEHHSHEHHTADKTVEATASTSPKTQIVQNLPVERIQAAENTPPQVRDTVIGPDEDADMASLGELSVLDTVRKASMLLENPVHSGRIKLQKQMRQETPQENFVHLTDNDNMSMLMPLMGGQPFSPGYYAADIRTMCKMTRIRKLLADAWENPDDMSSFLQEQLLTIAEKFPLAHEEFVQLIKNRPPGTKLTTRELRDVQKYRLLSTAAVYVLSEINAYDSLPLLAKLSSQGKTDHRPDFAGNCQINPKFLLYAMHKLVKGFPEHQLSEEAQKARANYLSTAKSLSIPDSRKVNVTTWDAYYHEDDFRKRRLGKKLYAQNQPTIELTEFPLLHKLSRGKVEYLRKRIITFVNAAFPE